MQLTAPHVLASAVAAALFLGPLPAIAGTVTGPGATHTINPGDPTEFRFVDNGGALIVAPGGQADLIQLNAGSLIGNDVALTGSVSALNGSSADIVGGLGAWAGLAGQQAGGYHQTSAQLGMSYSW